MSVRAYETTSVDRRDAAAIIRRLGALVLALMGFGLIVSSVVIVRAFAYEYFHGDRAAVHEMLRVLLGS